MIAPLAHVAGVPIEETLGFLAPVLLVAFGTARAAARARYRRMRPPGKSSAPGTRAGDIGVGV
jgi:hypothetical protein